MASSSGRAQPFAARHRRRRRSAGTRFSRRIARAPPGAGPRARGSLDLAHLGHGASLQRKNGPCRLLRRHPENAGGVIAATLTRRNIGLRGSLGRPEGYFLRKASSCTTLVSLAGLGCSRLEATSLGRTPCRDAPASAGGPNAGTGAGLARTLARKIALARPRLAGRAHLLGQAALCRGPLGGICLARGSPFERWPRFVRIGSLEVKLAHRVAGEIGAFELQAIGNAGVEEHADRRERHHQALLDAVEREVHLEPLLLDDQIPEAVLQDDRHLLRVLLPQTPGDDHARSDSVERNVEMMLAGKLLRLGHVDQHRAHDPAHGVLSQGLIVDVLLARHHQQNATDPPVAHEGSGGLLLPGALRNRA